MFQKISQNRFLAYGLAFAGLLAVLVPLSMASAPAASAAVDIHCGTAGTACTTTTVVSTYSQPIVNKIADNLPLVLAITFTMSGVFWIVYKLIKAARLKRP